MRGVLPIAVAAAALATLLCCASFTTAETAETAAASDGGAADAALEDGGPIPGRGPRMVDLGVGTFWIDTTEVTNEQYGAFTDACGQPSACPSLATPECSWKATHVPSEPWPRADTPNEPVVHVDWCDAQAFCKWAGKRLCGARDGGAVPVGQLANANVSQWFFACSSAGRFAYPYGDSFSSTTCVGSDTGANHALAVDRPDECHGTDGPFQSIFDMSGNVSEWEDACGPDDAGAALAGCKIRGGSFRLGPPNLACNFTGDGDLRNERTQPDVGIRCCWP